MSALLLSAIPQELRVLKQWVLWKDDKVPYQPNGQLASVTEPSHWSAFDEVFNCLQLGGWKGVGFVFTDNDPYTFIDLDNPNGDAAILERQLKVYHEFNSYAEVSPSGMGLHIIIKGKVQAGRRRSKIEVYSTGRYATMTGCVYDNRTNINYCQNELDQLWAQMGSGQIAHSLYKGDEKELYSDEEIINKAKNAVNGDKFNRLLSGDWSNDYSSQSEADFAFVDIIAFYTQNKLQIARIFRQSALGKRDKAKRKDYVEYMINKSFDRLIPNIDFDSSYNAVQEKLSASKTGSINGKSAPFDGVNVGSNPAPATNNGSVAQRSESSSHKGLVVGSSPTASTNHLTLPPGLLGEIAQFIYQAAPRPVPEIALAAAIGLMAGITGRAYNVSGTGLNQYLLILAKTGRGKEAAASGVDKLMNAVRMQVPTSPRFRGPAIINSGQALTKHLSHTSNCFVSILGEFGITIEKISNRNANSADKMLYQMLLDLYNKSGHGQTLQASIYSKKEDNVAMTESPAVTILGESTHKIFYDSLNEDMIAAGLLPRFLIIEYNGQRMDLNENHANAQPSFTLQEKFASLIAHSETTMHNKKVVNVDMNKEASEMLRAYDKQSTGIINKENDVIAELWNRAHMKVMRLSALVAVGVNPFAPVITAEYVAWAKNLVQADIKALTSKFESGEIGANSMELKQYAEIVKAIRDYVQKDYSYVSKYGAAPKLHNDKIISHSYLSSRLVKMAAFKNDRAGGLGALKRIIQALVDNGKLIVAGGVKFQEKYNTTQKAYSIHPSILDDI